jgi:hypothetical protein
MTTRKKITIFLFIIIFSLYFYVSWILSIFWLIISLWFYSIILYLIISPFKKFKNKEYKIFDYKNYLNFLQRFLYSVSVIIIILITILWSFAFYQNEISPAMMPVYTITNWEKTVVFQSMSHIWSENFYDKVRKNIKYYKENWFVLFFEWVRPGNDENMKKFDQALWVQFDKSIYKNFSKLYWLTYQDNQSLLWIVNNNDFNVDVWIDDIIKNYEQIKTEKKLEKRTYKEPVNVSEQIVTELAKLRENELKILRYINKSLVNIIIKSGWVQNTLMNNFSNQELFQVIVDGRNQVVASEIKKSEYNKIIITYWLLHFKWIFDILKKDDIKWRIEKIDYINVIN